MQSKLVVNILALVALLGLATFGVVSIIDFNDTIIDQRKTSDKSKQVIENHDIVDANVNLQTNLTKLKEKNKSLQESIFQNEITQGALVESVLDLENEKALVVRELEALEKKKLELSKFKGKYMLFVNVASNCGFTNQYKSLQKLFQDLLNIHFLFYP